MTVKIAILGDTHLTYFKDLPKHMLKEINEADWVIHVGDYTFLDVIDGFIRIKGENFKGVYGNADPSYIRERVPSKEIIEILGKKIGITHPVSGGSSLYIEEKVLNEFKNEDVDIITFGHTHEPKIQYKDNILLINPGKGYLESENYGPSTTIAILEIDDKIQAKILKITS
ncbi:MAG: YfcE family phosphodiesterase [Promethearchaeota archaeon]